MPKTLKVPVAERALLARLNRHLKAKGEVIKKCRPSSISYHDLGDYYRVDLQSNGITAMHVDLAELATEAKLLKPYEVLA